MRTKNAGLRVHVTGNQHSCTRQGSGSSLRPLLPSPPPPNYSSIFLIECTLMDKTLETASGFSKSSYTIKMSTCGKSNIARVSGTDGTSHQRLTLSATPEGPSEQLPLGSLAPWVKVQQRPTGHDGPGLHSTVPPTTPRCPAALGERCSSSKSERLYFRAPREWDQALGCKLRKGVVGDSKSIVRSFGSRIFAGYLEVVGGLKS